MAISDSQKVDLLYKKLFGVAKSDTATNKSPSNEATSSPFINRGDKVWVQANSIPTTAASTAGIVQAYQTTSAVQTTADNTTTPVGGVYPTWKTSLTDWIPPEFGATYFISAYAGTTGLSDPTTGVGATKIFDSGSGGTGEWFFDYQAGVLNFIGTTIPAPLTSANTVYITGYRYIGQIGISTIAANTIYTQGVDATQNANIIVIQGTDVSQNNRMTIIEGTDVTQNNRMTIIEGTDVSQNARMAIIEGTDVGQNTRLTVIEGTNASQNVRLDYSNSTITIIQGVDTSQNARMTIIEGVDATQNTNISNKLNLTGSLNQTVSGNVTITQDLIVAGNLVLTGNINSQNVQQLAVADPLIILGIGNYVSDTKDIGFAGHYNDGTNAHAGLIRDSGTKEFYVFQGYTPELDANNNVVITDASFSKANLNANYVKGNLIATTAVVNGIDLNVYTQATYAQANVTIGVDTTQNTRLTVVEGTNLSQNVRLDYSNSAITIIQGTDTSQNVRLDYSNSAITIVQGVDASQNANIISLQTQANTLLPNTGSLITVNGVSQVYIANTTPSTSLTTGALQVAGGISANSLYVTGATQSVIGGSLILTGGYLILGNYAGTSYQNLGSGATLSGFNKWVTIGQNGLAGSNTYINIGSAAGSSNVTFNTATTLFVSNTTPSVSNTTGAIVVSGGVGISGNLYAANAWVRGMPVLTQGDLTTVTYTANYITMDPAAVPVPNVGMATSRGFYNFGNVASIQTYGDYDTAANTGFYSVNDESFANGTPGHVEYIGFTGISAFNRVILNINYTALSGHIQDIDIFNYTSNTWDTLAQYSGSGNWQQFALGVIDDAPYINTITGNVTIRNYHVSAGSNVHRTWIDYVALEQSITGGQGPRGSTGATGATGATGPVNPAAYDQANTATVLAQAAFDRANTEPDASSYLANTIIVANSAGYLSNSNTLFFASNNTLYLPGNSAIGIGTSSPNSAIHILQTAGTGPGNFPTITLDAGSPSVSTAAAAINMRINYSGTFGQNMSQIVYDWYGSYVTPVSGSPNSHGLNYISGRPSQSNHIFRNSANTAQVIITDTGQSGVSYSTQPVGTVLSNKYVAGINWMNNNANLQVTGNTVANGTATIQNIVLQGQNNLLTYSQNYTDASWIKQNVIVSITNSSSPDGNSTSQTANANVAGAYCALTKYVTPSSNAINGYWTFSIFASNGSVNNAGNIILNIGSAYANGAFSTNTAWNFTTSGQQPTVTFVNQTGTVSNTAVGVGSLGGGMYRHSVSALLYDPQATQLRVDILIPSTLGANTITLWGSQLEIGRQPSNYTYTTGAPVSTNNNIYIPSGNVQATNSLVSNKLNWVNSNNSSVVYQTYNLSTNSLDIVFG
jgi:hypothetical protein